MPVPNTTRASPTKSASDVSWNLPLKPAQVRPNSKTNDTVRYGGEHLLYDIKQGHLTALMTTHEARRLATRHTASGNDLRCKAIHDS